MDKRWFLYNKHTSKTIGDPKGYPTRFQALRDADNLFGIWHTDAIGVFHSGAAVEGSSKLGEAK